MTLFSQNSLPTKSQQEMRFLNVNNVFGVHESNVIEILQCLKSRLHLTTCTYCLVIAEVGQQFLWNRFDMGSVVDGPLNPSVN